MDFWASLLEAVVLLGAASLLGALFERLGQSAILGYLAAGLVLGPHALGLMSGGGDVPVMAEIGVALLLFSIGLEFSWGRLKRLGGIAFGGGALQMGLATLALAAAFRAAGFKGIEALALGLALAPSSTACVLRLLHDRSETDSVHGRDALGILLMQDLLVVPAVVLMSNLAGAGAGWSGAIELGQAVLVTALLFGLFYAIGHGVLPRILGAAALTRNRELLVLVAVVTAMGAAWSAHWLGVSPAVGAFVAGLLLSESPFAMQLRADTAPLKTLFGTVFFTAIGMVAEPLWAWNNAGLLILILSLLLAVKAAATTLAARAFRRPWRYCLATGFILAQAGEFSFVLAEVGLKGGVLPPEGFRLLVSAAVVSMFLTPWLVARGPGWARAMERRLQQGGTATPATGPESPERVGAQSPVVLVGYGPAGLGVAAAVEAAGWPLIVVDLNPRSIEQAAAHGRKAELGDATQADFLEHLKVASARAVVVTLPDHRAASQVIRQVRSLTRGVPVVARARYNIHASVLAEAGAHLLVNEEQEIGRLLGEQLRKLIE